MSGSSPGQELPDGPSTSSAASSNLSSDEIAFFVLWIEGREVEADFTYPTRSDAGFNAAFHTKGASTAWRRGRPHRECIENERTIFDARQSGELVHVQERAIAPVRDIRPKVGRSPVTPRGEGDEIDPVFPLQC